MAASIHSISLSEQSELLPFSSSTSDINPFFIREFFSGRPPFWSGRGFEDFYPKMREKIQLLEAKLRTGADLSSIFSQIETVLKIEAKIANSVWGRNPAFKALKYLEFQEKIENLRQAAALKIDAETPKARAVRWILADESQRRLAAFINSDEVPYRFDEIPKAAVILFDPRLYLKGAQLKKTISIAKAILFHIKAFFCWIATGKRYTHAELSLGKGESFDLDKKKGCLFQGEMKIQSRGNKICYGAVMAPNEEKMLKAHQDAFRKRGLIPYETFDDLWNAIDGEARRSVSLIEATFFDIIRVAFNFKRPENYDSMKAWRPGEKRYGCSATTSALFSKFGIDIGKQFHKMDQNVAPADFLHSEYFHLL